MSYDLTALDALEQKITREGNSLFIRTRNKFTNALVHEYEFTNAPTAPTPQEVDEVCKAIRTCLALNIPNVNNLGQLVTPSGDVVGGVTYPMTNNYRLRCILNRAAGVLVDSGGRGFNGYAAAGNDVMWGTRGYFSSKTTAAGTDGSVQFSTQAFDWEFNGSAPQSLILSMRVKGSAPASAQRLLGNSSASTVKGFALSALTDGKLGVRFADGTNEFNAISSNRAALDGTDHFVFVTIDAKTRIASIWIDDEDIPSAASGVAVTGTTRNATELFRFGMAGLPASLASMACGFADVQIFTVIGGLPANISEIRKILQADPAAEIGTDLLPNRTPGSGDAVAPVTAGATAQTKSLYRYLKSFSGREAFVFGAHDRFDDPAYAPNAHGYLDIYQSIAGRKPAMMQWEYVDSQQADDGAGSTGAVRQPNLLAAMRAFAASGGINMLHDHPGHPVTGTMSKSMIPSSGAGSAWDTTAGGLAAINTGGAQEAQFLAYLDRLAAFIAAVGTPVIYRPFHEVNGNWFWWGGAATATTFKAVWIKMYNYLTVTKGLTNVLFCLNLSGTDDSTAAIANNVQAYSQWYPGDAYVDIVSIDYYNDRAWSESTIWSLARKVLREGFDALNVLAAPGGKPVLFAEAGYANASAQKADLWELVGSDMASIYRDCAALGLWRAPWGPDASHASAGSLRTLMDKDYCITLDKSSGAAYAS